MTPPLIERIHTRLEGQEGQNTVSDDTKTTKVPKEQEEVENWRRVIKALGEKKYGAALTERLMQGLAPISLIRVMCEDAIHDEWPEEEIALVRSALRVFRQRARP